MLRVQLDLVAQNGPNAVDSVRRICIAEPVKSGAMQICPKIWKNLPWVPDYMRMTTDDVSCKVQNLQAVGAGPASFALADHGSLCKAFASAFLPDI